MVDLILVSIAFLLFIVYNSIAISFFGIPWSLSKTYYLYEEKKKGLGILFIVFMWIMAFILLPGWIGISIAVGSWMQYLTFLTFITSGCIAFVGTAPRYYQELEGIVHMTSAKICAVTALLWCFVVCWNIWYVPLIGMLIAVILGLITKSWIGARDYWIEMMAFYATFLTIIVEGILLL